jgi:DNA helicase II / ATP-dependent DNA helicase PcrA
MTRRIDQPDTPADLEIRRILDADTPSSLVVLAGAGSGKTTTLIKALGHIEATRGAALRARRQEIACITYTNIAVEEIRGDLHNSPLVDATTLHSFLWGLVSPFQQDIRRWIAERIEGRLQSVAWETQALGPKARQSTRSRLEHDAARLAQAAARLENVRRFTYESAADYSKGHLGHDDIVRMATDLLRTKPLLGDILARQYPYCFVDESQDTLPVVVEALKGVAARNAGTFHLAFFGDPMQQIYLTGVGEITPEPGWAQITKPENYRCAPAVLAVLNNIRAQSDGLKQVGAQRTDQPGGPDGSGSARFFVLPADEHRADNLVRVRDWLADRSKNAAWLEASGDDDTRTLVIARRMAATQLGYPDLFKAFNDRTPEAVKTGLDEGSLWPLTPFIRVIVPLLDAAARGAAFEVISILRDHCPRIAQETWQTVADRAELLASLKSDIDALCRAARKEGATVRDVLGEAARMCLFRSDPRFQRLGQLLEETDASEGFLPAGPELSQVEDKIPDASLSAYIACPFEQVLRYCTYLGTQSPYSTQHGVKGAEFTRVLVVLDDELGHFSQYSYDTFLGLKEAPKPKNEAEAQKDGIVTRTRRLFYVCCSRARTDLAVVLYTADPDRAYMSLCEAGPFGRDQIYRLDDLLAEEQVRQPTPALGE